LARRRARSRPARSFVLLLLAGACVAFGYYFGLRADSAPGAVAPPTPARAARPASPRSAPAKAALPPMRTPSAPRAVSEEPAAVASPRLAIVIDDLGRSTAEVDRLLALKVPLTYAVLPWETRTLEVAALLRAAGVEVLCHLPMESATGANPGPNAILEHLTPERIAARTRAALDELPVAVGVNNHMGSAITDDPVAMAAVLDVVAQRGLFFLDSRTTKESIAFALARERAIPAASRDVFLDEAPEVADVEAAFDQLLTAAREQGAAIAIGHPRPATLEVLERRIPEAKEAGFEFVPVSYLLERDGGGP
jgi:polysaccharide deacetylase 2 family uncharacterized protein YibQ